MTDYYDPTENRKYNRNFRAVTPDIFEAFVNFDKTVFAEEGREIPLKYRELIGLGVALTTQCVFCIEAHTTGAAKAGATETEIAEASWVATALRAGGGFTHGRMALHMHAEHTNKGQE